MYTAWTAASASSRPWPNSFVHEPVPPQLAAGTGVAVAFRTCSIASTLPLIAGCAEISSATVPATCGVAIDVPLDEPKPPPGKHERTLTPGAAMSGLMRPLPSMVTGPRLEKPASERSSQRCAPTL